MDFKGKTNVPHDKHSNTHYSKMKYGNLEIDCLNFATYKQNYSSTSLLHLKENYDLQTISTYITDAQSESAQ